MPPAGAEIVAETDRPGTDRADDSGAAEARRTLRILRAVETYKVACAAEGKQPSEEESWLVLLAALHAPVD